MEVEVVTDPEPQLGAPCLLFAQDEEVFKLGKGVAIAGDGRSFVGIRELPVDDGEREVRQGIHVVQNWFAEFQR